MRTAYFDLVSGASGDMILGALVDAGLPLADLQRGLAALQLPDLSLTATRVQRGAFAATQVTVHTGEHAPTRHLADIAALVNAASLPERVRTRALAVFERMVEAEAGIHHIPAAEVHLHELGAVDTIVDVVGAFLALDLLGVEAVTVSPFPLGRGMSKSQHGPMPLPAPATVALLRGAPVVGVPHALETVTPTAAALLTELAGGFGPIPAMRLSAVGYGAGSRTAPEPNLLRVFLGESAAEDDAGGAEVETLALLETNIDNMNPEFYGYLSELLLAEGALDVYGTPVYMKKGRPATVLSVLCRPDDTARLRGLLFRESTTIGIRTLQVMRHALPRRIESVATQYGAIRVKVAAWAGEEKATPEYEDCAAAARATHAPLRLVYEAALAGYLDQRQKLAAQTP